MNTASAIVDKLRSGQKLKPSQVKEYLKNEFSSILQNAGSNVLSYKDGELNTYFIVGVNGAGKTTLIGKLANRFRIQGKKSLLQQATLSEQPQKNSSTSGASVQARRLSEMTVLTPRLWFLTQ